MSATDLLHAEIAAHGPIPFSRFMNVALYDAEHGYYRRDHFGKHGDFYTAEQLQPTFGKLLRNAFRELGVTRIVQPGAGRAALAESFTEFEYTAIDVGYGAWPERFDGLVLAHEFFDALPVDVAEPDGTPLLVKHDGERFVWDRVVDESVEVPVGLERELRFLAERCQGYLLVLDYGYTERERMRFPQGSLMSYRSHRAIDDVLANPGEQDITAHVPFSTLEALAHQLGYRTLRFESLGSFLLRAGEADGFAGIVPEHSLQLKTLLFGIGESFRALLLEKR